MICHEFKGGIGTSSRVVTTAGRYTVGALVQANYGRRASSCGWTASPSVADRPRSGVPCARRRGLDARGRARSSSSSPPTRRCCPSSAQRLAQRATVGLARVGGTGYNGSGDIFLAFATGNRRPRTPGSRSTVRMLPNAQMDPLFERGAEAVEEAILNALTAAETMTGFEGHTAHALPLEDVRALVARRHPLNS